MQGQRLRQSRRGFRLLPVGALLAIGWVGPGCQNHIGTTAASFLRKVRDDPDPNVRYVAYDKLASPNCYDTEQQKDEAAATLVDKLENGLEPVGTRALICKTLGALGKPVAREAIVKATNDIEPIVRIEACRALGKVGRDEDATILARVMMIDTQEDCRIAAIDGLIDLKPKDKRIQEVLINGMQHDDPAIRLGSVKALERITGERFGVDAIAWRQGLHLEDGTMMASGERKPAVDPALQPVGIKAKGGKPQAENAVYPPKPKALGERYDLSKIQP